MADLKLFLDQSSDFYNVFTSSTLDDYRALKREKPENFIFLISQVSFSETDVDSGCQSHA